MNDARCRFDRDAGEYLTPDGEPCDVPKREHCTARKTCANHLGWGELTCARCVGRTRQDIRQIVNLAALMLPEAVETGVESRAANLAGPAGDPLVLSWRRVNEAKASGTTVGDGTDETDPTEVLGIWQAMLSEDYSHDLPDRITLASAAAYLERHLHTIAQDEEQDFPLMAREVRKCRANLEAVLRNSQSPERGAPCPDCKADGHVVRMVREYAHWCEDPECERIHFDTDEGDVWRCPRRPEHWRSHEDYLRWVEERVSA